MDVLAYAQWWVQMSGSVAFSLGIEKKSRGGAGAVALAIRNLPKALP